MVVTPPRTGQDGLAADLQRHFFADAHPAKVVPSPQVTWPTWRRRERRPRRTRTTPGPGWPTGNHSWHLGLWIFGPVVLSTFGSLAQPLGLWYLGRPEGAGLTSGTLSASRSTGHSWQAESPICHLHNVPMATFSAGKDG